MTKVVKVVAGDGPETLKKIATLYEAIVEPGVHQVSSIKVAEAEKVYMRIRSATSTLRS